MSAVLMKFAEVTMLFNLIIDGSKGARIEELGIKLTMRGMEQSLVGCLFTDDTWLNVAVTLLCIGRCLSFVLECRGTRRCTPRTQCTCFSIILCMSQHVVTRQYTLTREGKKSDMRQRVGQNQHAAYTASNTS